MIDEEWISLVLRVHFEIFNDRESYFFMFIYYQHLPAKFFLKTLKIGTFRLVSMTPCKIRRF